jgi:molybdopterin synthase catalytic subunit
MAVRIQTDPFDPGQELNAFLLGSDSAGGAVTFTGLVRSDPHDPITTLTLECYVDLARNQIAAMEAEAIARFGLMRISVIHRYGRLAPGEPIVQVMTLAAHRGAAFEAAEFLMDYLKTDAPFWKKETTAKGERWVEHNPDDDRAQSRWRIETR